MPSTLQIVTFIIGSAAVIFGAYFATYLVAKGSQRVYKGRAIRVLDRFSLTKDKYIVLLAVYDNVYLVAFSSGAVTLLDTLEPQIAQTVLNEDMPASVLSLGQSFNTALAGFMRKLPKDNTGAAKKYLPFEAYLHRDGGNHGRTDTGSLVRKKRGEKEATRNTDVDNAYFEEDILK